MDGMKNGKGAKCWENASGWKAVLRPRAFYPSVRLRLSVLIRAYPWLKLPSPCLFVVPWKNDTEAT